MLPDNMHATILTADGKHFSAPSDGEALAVETKFPFARTPATMTPEAVFRVAPAEPPANLPARHRVRRTRAQASQLSLGSSHLADLAQLI